MRFLSAVHTDIGISKKNNQDAFCLKIARTSKHNIAFAVLCDGMGGLKSGELASAFVVNAYSAWFENEFSNMTKNNIDFKIISKKWTDIALGLGQKIMSYGANKGISLGTTLTGLLIVDKTYIYIHVGDSRIYKINEKITQITNDHTVIAKEIAQKKITEEQAKTDGRKNVLLQCVGASKTIVPDVEMGDVNENDMFLLCSDGFRHEISKDEIAGVIAPSLMKSEMIMKKSLVDLIELNKQRQEKDNITALLIKAIR